MNVLHVESHNKTFRAPLPTLGRSLECLMGDGEFSNFDSLVDLYPNDTYDSLIHDYIQYTDVDTSQIISTPWTDRVLGDKLYLTNPSSSVSTNALATKKRYKPVHRKVWPVPTFMLNPEAQRFYDILPPVPTLLPHKPKDYRDLDFGPQVTFERLEYMLGKIEPGILMTDETNLLAYIVTVRDAVFTFEYPEKGSFSQDYYPDYEIPTIEHTPWQAKLIPFPEAIVEDIKKEIRVQEKAGRYEPTVSSYRSAMFPVAKKGGV